MTNPTETDLMALAGLEIVDGIALCDTVDGHHSSFGGGVFSTLESVQQFVKLADANAALTTLQSKLDAAEARVRELETAIQEAMDTVDDAWCVTVKEARAKGIEWIPLSQEMADVIDKQNAAFGKVRAALSKETP